jgi:hypothetical protein
MRSSSTIMKKVFIGGDSWGCGEWTHEASIAHKGVETYFNEVGYNVVNSSAGKVSNFMSIDRLQESLKEKYSEADLIFWFKTDTIRDLHHNNYYTLTNELKKFGNFKGLINFLSDNSYNNLNQLAARHNTKIYLIGGYGSLIPDLLEKYDNLVPLVPSVVDLLVGHHEKYSAITKNFQGTTNWGIKHINLKEYDLSMAGELIIELSNMCAAKDNIFQEKIFWPDGHHPNRHGHRILFDYIMKKLN